MSLFKKSDRCSATIILCSIQTKQWLKGKQLKRNFIGMELDDKYFEIAKQRIMNA